MNSTLYRCPRCEQTFSFAEPVAGIEFGGSSGGYVAHRSSWSLHVCRRCGQYLCNPDAALDALLQVEALRRRLTVVRL